MRLRIISSGMCCSVGLSGPQARAAIRVGINRFTESSYLDEAFEPIVFAQPAIEDLRGPARLAKMLDLTITEALGPAPASATALWLLTPPHEWLGTHARTREACVEVCTSHIGDDARVHLSPGSAATLAEILVAVEAELTAGHIQRALVCAVDSLLNPQAINHYLRRQRLAASGITDGFIPSEGAASILLTLDDGSTSGVVVTGVGSARASAAITDDRVQTGDGLVAATREALGVTKRKMSELSFQLLNLSGESYFFGESALALARALDRRVPNFPLLHLTDSIGHTGVAAGVLALAHLAGAMPKAHTPGPLGIVQLVADDTARGAIVLESRHVGA